MAKKAKAKAKTPVKSHELMDFPALNVKQLHKRISKAKEASLKMRKHLWPKLKENQLWDRKTKGGYTTVPRTMSMLMNIINKLSKKVNDGKAAPAGQAYLVLWCRAWDDPMVRIDSERAAAAETGYTGERNISTWRSHLRILKDLGFIDYKDAGSSQYIIIYNPYLVVKARKVDIQTGTYAALLQRALEIGAGADFD